MQTPVDYYLPVFVFNKNKSLLLTPNLPSSGWTHSSSSTRRPVVDLSEFLCRAVWCKCTHVVTWVSAWFSCGCFWWHRFRRRRWGSTAWTTRPTSWTDLVSGDALPAWAGARDKSFFRWCVCLRCCGGTRRFWVINGGAVNCGGKRVLFVWLFNNESYRTGLRWFWLIICVGFCLW